MKLRPLHDRVVIRRSEEETKTAGGIVLPFIGIKAIDLVVTALHLA